MQGTGVSTPARRWSSCYLILPINGGAAPYLRLSRAMVDLGLARDKHEARSLIRDGKVRLHSSGTLPTQGEIHDAAWNAGEELMIFVGEEHNPERMGMVWIENRSGPGPYDRLTRTLGRIAALWPIAIAAGVLFGRLRP